MKKMLIFTDGSSLGNPGAGGFGVVIVSSSKKVIELGGREKKTTNNRMELMAVISALEYCVNKETTPISIYSDSRYVINGVTKWLSAWQKNGWQTKNKTDVLNKDLWQKILMVISKIKNQIEWQYVPGHVGVPGNERTDEIAQSFAFGKKVMLYNGSLEKYHIKDILRTPSLEDISSKKSGKAYSYLSLVDGIIKCHDTWDECKNRVSGKSGVKFKKTFSKTNEEEIMRDWTEKYP